ncbi:MAG: hypothetical protein WBG32_13040 [Nodosilinea sp.]
MANCPDAIAALAQMLDALEASAAALEQWVPFWACGAAKIGAEWRGAAGFRRCELPLLS